MVIIISSESDYSTILVYKWLIKFGIDTIRINGEDNVFIKKLDLQNDHLELIINNATVDFAKVSCIWYRRGKLNFVNGFSNKYYYKLQEEEAKYLNHYIFEKIIKNKCIGLYSNESTNKLLVQKIAISVGLSVPKSYISGSSDFVKELIEKNSFITKTIGTPLAFHKKDMSYMGYTEEISSSDIKKCKQYFFPSFFQEKIRKKIELRIFYFLGECFTMAIFSQNNKKTITDFRKYDSTLPNRVVPYRLPKNIQLKINKLFKALDLLSGSVDMIIDESNNYIFLEINPVGQFGMVSVPCHFYLEKMIAKKLASYEKK